MTIVCAVLQIIMNWSFFFTGCVHQTTAMAVSCQLLFFFSFEIKFQIHLCSSFTCLKGNCNKPGQFMSNLKS